MTVMKVSQFAFSRRSLGIAAALIGTLSLAIGAHAALSLRALDAAKAVSTVQDAGKDDMARAIDRLKAKIRRDSVVMLFFGGYGVQVGRESYMIPVDAVIWKEHDVKREGVAVEAVLEVMKAQGA